MTESPLAYAALLREPEQLDVPAVARVLARVRGCPVQDAMPAARACWGIVAESQSEASAKELAAALSAAGLQALALPQNLLEELPPAVPVARMEFGAEEAVFFAADGTAYPVRAEQAALLAACVLKREETRTIKVHQDIGLFQKAAQLGLLMATGIPIRTAKLRREVDKSVSSPELVGLLDIHVPGKRLRLLSQDFDYSGLKERKGYEALANFQILARELAALWPGAARSRGLRFILDGRPQREMGYDSPADLEREGRWLMTLRALGPRV